MDKRQQLPAGYALRFPGLTCFIDSCVGMGSNAIVYKGWYADGTSQAERHDVLVKEFFPLEHGGGVYRAADGAICVTEEAQEFCARQRSSFERGNDMHLRLLRKRPDIIGANINTYALNGTYYTLLGFSGGCSMEEAMARGLPRSLSDAVLWTLGILDALEAFHSAGCLHMDISPDNILIVHQAQRDQLLLIDYNSVHSMESWQNGLPLLISVKEGYTAPEVRTGAAGQIGFSSDLYAVTAVLFTLLTGRRLSIADQVAGRPAAFLDSPLLSDAPEPVTAMVGRILTRGLQTLPARRYQSIAQMRCDLEELLDRIHCIGVTHWAIWEKERQRLDRLIRRNPSMAFLRDQAALYPICLSDGEAALGIEALLGRLMEPSPPAVICGDGGMGKTTALELLALRLNGRYSPRMPAAVFLRAADYRQGEQWFIHDSILRSLKFSSDTGSYEMARHELSALLEKRIPDGRAGKPQLVILLDGLNEIACDMAPLLAELELLASMPGVSLVISSRGGVPLRESLSLQLTPLPAQTVNELLGRHGLLPPEDGQMRGMLRVPLLLSLFIQAAEGSGQQVRFSDMDSLMRAYLDALLSKESARAQGDARYLSEAAVRYVLPAAASAMRRQGGCLEEGHLLEVVSRCYSLLKSGGMRRVFPQWAGVQSAILAGAQSPQEWYALVVRDILWRRMGLLVQDGDGCFRICHQLIADWLAQTHEPIRRAVRREHIRRRTARWGCAAIFCVLLAVGGLLLVRGTPYDRALAEALLANAENAYILGGSQYSMMTDVLNAVRTDDDVEQHLSSGEQTLAYCSQIYSGIRESAPEDVYLMMETGRYMPWSRQPVDVQTYARLIELPQQWQARCAEYLQELCSILNEEGSFSDRDSRYLNCLQTLMDDYALALGACYSRVVLAERACMSEDDPLKGIPVIPAAQGQMTAQADQPPEYYLERIEKTLEELDEIRRGNP